METFYFCAEIDFIVSDRHRINVVTCDFRIRGRRNYGYVVSAAIFEIIDFTIIETPLYVQLRCIYVNSHSHSQGAAGTGTLHMNIT
jgi:hypothetical protein